MDRRVFLQTAAIPCLMATESDAQYIVEARFYEKQPYKKIKCTLCPRECVIDDHERGYCGVRENRGGTYYSLVHSRVCSAHIDPIEKKPFFHFLPGALAFSIATAGCNVNCKMCQNWEISQVRPEQVRSTYLPPKGVPELARQNRCPVIAYTYSEPVVSLEYVLDVAEAGRAAGVKSAVVTGGYIQEKPLIELCRRVDAVKVDLKAFSDQFYREVVNGELKHVLNTLVCATEAKGLERDRVPGNTDAERLRPGVQGSGKVGEVRTRTRRSAALLAFPSRVPVEEPASDAAADPRARQGHLRRGRT